jgi:hypothetical protein
MKANSAILTSRSRGRQDGERRTRERTLPTCFLPRTSGETATRSKTQTRNPRRPLRETGANPLGNKNTEPNCNALMALFGIESILVGL